MLGFRFFLVSLLILACLTPAPTLAGEAGGRAGADFLEIPIGARSLALGGATGPLPGDLASLFRNPALLASDRGYRLHLSHQEWYQDLRLESAMMALSLPPDWGRAAIHMRYLHLDPIPAYNSDLQRVGEVDVYDLALGISWARRISNRWDLGLNLHNVRQHLVDEEGSGWSWDLGTGFVAKGFYWSAAFRNLGNGVKYDEERFSFDREFSLGAARYLPRYGLIFTLEYRQPRYWGSSFQGGVEYMMLERLTLRAGYAKTLGIDEGLPSFGLGILLGGVGFDYSYRSHDQLGDLHAVSLRFLGLPKSLSPYRFFRSS